MAEGDKGWREKIGQELEKGETNSLNLEESFDAMGSFAAGFSLAPISLESSSSKPERVPNHLCFEIPSNQSCEINFHETISTVGRYRILCMKSPANTPSAPLKIGNSRRSAQRLKCLSPSSSHRLAVSDDPSSACFTGKKYRQPPLKKKFSLNGK
ncbi:hypothetical protein U1Q18_008933 [Sarracenia purpurea var. burkii]